MKRMIFDKSKPYEIVAFVLAFIGLMIGLFLLLNILYGPNAPLLIWGFAAIAIFEGIGLGIFFVGQWLDRRRG